MKSAPLFQPAATVVLALVTASMAAYAQAPKPAPEAPKPPVHKPEQSILNRLKQDDRAKSDLDEAVAKLREAAKNNETAEKELKRLDLKSLKEDPAKALDSIKDQLSPEAAAELKATFEKAKQSLNSEEAKKMIEEAKKKAAASIKPKSATNTTPPAKFAPSTFDQVPAPVPIAPEPVVAKRKEPGFMVNGDSVIFPPTQDPANPKRSLPPSDPRSRTYIVTGNAQVKTPSMVLDGDRIEMIKSVESGGINAAPPLAKPAKGKTGDPVQPGIGAANEKAPAPFDRVMATGRVNIVRLIDGKTQTGKGGSMIYEKKSGTMILTDWPQAQVEGKVITGKSKDAKIILVPEGEPRVENCRIEGYDEPVPAAPKGTPAAPKVAPAPKAKVEQ